MTLQTPEDNGPKRRRPMQARSLEKLELIFESTIRLLDKEGLEGLSTNRIAEVAGISIGTLYQYFSNKQEVMEALGRREIESVMGRLGLLLSAPGTPDPTARARLLVRALLSAFGGRHRVRKLLLEVALASGSRQALEGSAAQVAQWLSSGHAVDAENRALVMRPMAAFVLTQAVMGVMRSALAADETLLADPELEDNLVRLIRGFLNEGAARHQAAAGGA
ncbi:MULTISPECIES: TetR/AcrR family transcriptional regulator [Cupriavidus]|uniref:TetR/AcrR family transcriptional regulator n=1 Tax=Cupriavidus TaxID=106589 RepID=UPI0016010E4E|nr:MULTISPECIES: TetR/AcrR family transcriptional regulator [Cupriavidus]MDR3384177.1 TetR/AcrR family transcriptional regulator [Cupriavidus basilensis]